MVKLSCSDYGFDCDFMLEGEPSEIIEKFAKHTLDEHGIEYSKEALMQFIIRKSQWSKISNFAKLLCKCETIKVAYYIRK